MVVILAFTIDLGLLLSARTEMQRSADSAALAGAWEMVSDDLVRGDTNTIALAPAAAQPKFRNITFNPTHTLITPGPKMGAPQWAFA